jgi:6-phosphogluconate dehydrogenase
MTNKQAQQQYAIGMVGLGVMGRNLALHMADHGFSVIGFDKEPNKVVTLEKEGRGKRVAGARLLEECLRNLKKPRALMMLVPAGQPVDDVVSSLLPYLKKGDIIIDGGNSHFSDTDRRQNELSRRGLHFLGIGMPGGPLREDGPQRHRVRPDAAYLRDL